MKLLKPKALRRGDAIGVVAPAGPVDRERIDRALGRVRERGFRIKTYGDLYRSQGYFAGDDATRARELMAAFKDSETSAVWCARGGYGVVRLLERMDFDLIRRHPKVFIGFSDITALHVAMQQRAGLVTFHGPNLQDGFGKADEMPAATEAALWRAVLADEGPVEPSAHEELRAASRVVLDPGRGATIRRGWCPPPGSQAYVYEFDFAGMEQGAMQPITAGVAQGPLTGGNLAVLCGLMGTPFEIDTAGRILFLEDVSERLYRIDRYLAQLALAGKLQQAAGIIVGTFSYEEGDQAELESAVFSLLEEYLGGLATPVIAGFPAGHGQYNLTLPMGAGLQIDADALRVRLLENPVG